MGAERAGYHIGTGCPQSLGRTPLPFFNKKLLVLESKQSNEISKKGKKKRSRYVTKTSYKYSFPLLTVDISATPRAGADNRPHRRNA
ncbi:hypothetical protein KC221_24565, partial [Mycobacterium tuberculosis]|nr:hypothetical protein [Mycobacterium tuberculosis]